MDRFGPARGAELPRIDDRLQTRPHRYFNVSAKSAGRPTGEFNVLLRSDWVVLDASDITAGPVATVELPFRVPAGLHGNWFML